MAHFKLGELLHKDPELYDEQIIQAKQNYYFLPVGIFPKEGYRRQLIEHPEEFGVNQALVCDFYNSQQGSCTIWPYRSSECREFTCASESIDSKSFEKEMLDVQMVLIYKGVDVANIKKYLDIYNLESMDTVEELTNPQEYYLDCYNLYMKHVSEWQNDNK